MNTALHDNTANYVQQNVIIIMTTKGYQLVGIRLSLAMEDR